MNESTQAQLKIIVERVVRPVRASVCHKVKVREELLAHVTAVFEEEAARLGNEQAALERAAQRFGNPAELTGQLQQSVPTTDLIRRFMEFVAFRTNESTLRRAVQFAVMMFIICGIALSVFIEQGRLNELPFLILLPPTVFFFVVSSDWMRQALNGRFWRRVAVVAAVLSFLIPGATFGVLLTSSGDVRSNLTDVLPLLPAALLTPVLFVLAVYGFAVEFRSHREWMSLQIN